MVRLDNGKVERVMSHMFYGKELVFKESSHRYFWGGEPVRSVTTILGVLAKPMLIPWAANMAVEYIRQNCLKDECFIVSEADLDLARKAHTKKKTDAADAGSAVHEYAESVLNGTTPQKPATPEVAAGVRAFESFMKEHKLEPLAVERRIFSKNHMYAGTTDFYGFVDGEAAILDFKTSSGIYDEFWLQTAGYEVAISEELFDSQAQHLKRILIHLDKATGEYKLYKKHFSALHRDAWLNVVLLDRSLQQMKKKEAA